MRNRIHPWDARVTRFGARCAAVLAGVVLASGCSGTPSGSTGSTGNFHPSGSGTSGGMGIADSGGCTFDGEPCDGGECCEGTCTDPSGDPANCGVCGNACSGSNSCCNGMCTDENVDTNNCGGCGNACPGSNLCCTGNCVDATSDPNNCSACGVACGPNFNCCSGGCSNPASDPNNCGGCGNACGSSQSCQQQSCVVVDCTQPGTSGQPCFPDGGSNAGVCCASACLDFTSDPDNCGGCGDVCPNTTSCQSSNCVLTNGSVNVCPQPGTVDCSAGLACVAGAGRCALTSCGSAADGTACAEPNGGLGMCCGQVCIDPSSDPNNCAACGNACGAGDVCTGGSCGPGAPGSCQGGLATSCALGDGGQGECCAEGCVDTNADVSNCGGCAVVCATGESCLGGSCLVQACGLPSAQGLACGRADGGVGQCCGGVCRSFDFDDSNCGGCGEACPIGATCSFGSCEFPDAGADQCPFTDGGDCAAGQVCEPTSHRCVVASCGALEADPPELGGRDAGRRPDAGRLDAGPEKDAGSPEDAGSLEDGGPSDGGAQDAGVPDAGAPDAGAMDPGAMDAGRAADGGVDAGPADAGSSDGGIDGGPLDAGPPDAGVGDGGYIGRLSDTAACARGPSSQGMCCAGGCVDIASDPVNCGGCGLACASGQICVHASCAVATYCEVNPDAGSCPVDGDGGTGVCCGAACAQLDTDSNNCGACGHGCASGESCWASRCGIDACDPSHAGAPCFSPALTDGGLLDGGLGTCCSSGCVDTDSDPANCGGCGLSCTGAQSCVSGGCQS